jgi:DNA-binding winged helix-turn-helix (wHTH) protein/tetratricopeptide (TPR) repeat protein
MPITGGIFEFGPFRLEPAERRLVRGPDAIALTPKAFDLLIFLVGHPDRLLKKEELLEHLWPGVFVEEVNLAQNISAIRRALGGEGRESYIQTVAGTGYRFVAPVRRSNAARDDSAPRSSPAFEIRKRLLVLPFRMLKPDPDVDFLGFSLPDALTAELSAIDSLIVRSSLVAAKFAGEAPDLTRISREAHVDFVVSGTILRVGAEVRVSAQLSDAAAGTLLWSHTVQSPMDDLFQLQDSLTGRIVESLSKPLTAPEQRRLRHDVPATPKAYELYLRANQLSPFVFARDQSVAARDLYLQSLEEDPSYAPTWARLARMYRLIGKLGADDTVANLQRADEALQHALRLNPDLTIAHHLYSQIEVDRGQAPAAMRRLLERLQQRGPNAELYAGLVHACRFSGLLDASIAAHERAVALDAATQTGVMHAYFVRRRWEKVVEVSGHVRGYVFALSLSQLGRDDEALMVFAEMEKKGPLVDFMLAGRELIARRPAESAAAMTRAIRTLQDPESIYYVARHLAHLGDTATALNLLEQSVDGGYTCVEPLLDDPWLDSVRGAPRFAALLARARERNESALAVFQAARGPQLLGLENDGG